MDFISTVSRDQLMAILNTSIDRIYKKEQSKKFLAHSAELDYISNIFTQYCSNQLTKVELLEYFPVDDNFKDTVLKTIEIRKPQICQHLVNLHNQSQISLMKSFDWDLKLVVGSSSLSTHRDQIATLMLNCQRGKEEEMLSMELDNEMLNKFISELEKIEV